MVARKIVEFLIDISCNNEFNSNHQLDLLAVHML